MSIGLTIFDSTFGAKNIDLTLFDDTFGAKNISPTLLEGNFGAKNISLTKFEGIFGATNISLTQFEDTFGAKNIGLTFKIILRNQKYLFWVCTNMKKWVIRDYTKGIDPRCILWNDAKMVCKRDMMLSNAL